jgi:hypothetical protein
MGMNLGMPTGRSEANRVPLLFDVDIARPLKLGI